ncbi:uncharacterized protein MONOS_17083 [Monocercomonoides exilis]|uniref:uncharacterized protein n=1 Tax=Monocercomonoides exilis TaxID=2049356 RepID=UPI00355996B9|nr:hypothetical protein MONOS_17083 [Monocercomonoides exilis]
MEGNRTHDEILLAQRFDERDELQGRNSLSISTANPKKSDVSEAVHGSLLGGASSQFALSLPIFAAESGASSSLAMSAAQMLHLRSGQMKSVLEQPTSSFRSSNWFSFVESAPSSSEPHFVSSSVGTQLPVCLDLGHSSKAQKEEPPSDNSEPKEEQERDSWMPADGLGPEGLARPLAKILGWGDSFVKNKREVLVSLWRSYDSEVQRRAGSISEVALLAGVKGGAGSGTEEAGVDEALREEAEKARRLREKTIRVEIKEARIFHKMFGVWVGKDWVVDEAERVMWEAAEEAAAGRAGDGAVNEPGLSEGIGAAAQECWGGGEGGEGWGRQGELQEKANFYELYPKVKKQMKKIKMEMLDQLMEQVELYPRRGCPALAELHVRSRPHGAGKTAGCASAGVWRELEGKSREGGSEWSGCLSGAEADKGKFSFADFACTAQAQLGCWETEDKLCTASHLQPALAGEALFDAAFAAPPEWEGCWRVVRESTNAEVELNDSAIPCNVVLDENRASLLVQQVVQVVVPLVPAGLFAGGKLPSSLSGSDTAALVREKGRRAKRETLRAQMGKRRCWVFRPTPLQQRYLWVFDRMPINFKKRVKNWIHGKGNRDADISQMPRYLRVACAEALPALKP